MKNLGHKTLFWAMLFALSVFGIGTVRETAAQENMRASASGQGSLPAMTETGDTRKRQFSFSAHRGANGMVKGNAVLHNPAFTVENGQKYQLQISISCMKVIGNTAFFGGTTRRTNDPNLVDAVFFAVEDNGEPGRGSDRISRVYFQDDDPQTPGNPQLCQNNDIGDFLMEVIEAGNVNLRAGATANP